MPPVDDKKYAEITEALHKLHLQLLRDEADGKLKSREDPDLTGDYLTKIRLRVSLLFVYDNQLLDELNKLITGVADFRQETYETMLKAGKSENAAKNHSSEVARRDEAKIREIENKRWQIKNEVTRYDGICSVLQSRLRGLDAEKRLG